MARAGEPRVLDAGAWSGVRGREAVTDRLPVRGSPWILRQPATVPATPACGHGFEPPRHSGFAALPTLTPIPLPWGEGLCIGLGISGSPQASGWPRAM